VCQARSQLGFGVKAFDQFGGRQGASADQLERHRTVQAGLTGAIDGAHSAPGDLLDQFVIAEVPDAKGNRVGGLEWWRLPLRFIGGGFGGFRGGFLPSQVA
jgi:hypothetical protein